MKDKYKKLLNNLLFYRHNREKLQQVYYNQYLLISEQMVVGIFPTYEEAIQTGSKNYNDGCFLVKHCWSVSA